jgi:oxaloacetate decarboxylase alpha subunit
VEKFVERAAVNGIDVFRVFDAMNDMRNLQTALKAVKQVGKHAQGTISYTVSPVHTIDLWVDLARQIEDAGADSICIKDMAGLLTPYVGYELVTKLKGAVDIPLQLHAHATTGLSTATIMKCVEAGIDNVDTAISSMAMTYGHSATESVVSIFKESERDTGLDVSKLEEIAAYFRPVRKKYAEFEGSLKGVDSRILVAQVPGGMLTNMEGQLRQQGAEDRLDEVLLEIPRVREDLGFIPLVTPTSQIVGTQSVLNVLTGERYKSITKETAGVLRGEYGATPSSVNEELQARVLDEGETAITCRPADNLDPEIEKLKSELMELSSQEGFELTAGDGQIDDVLTYALFPQVGLKFLKHKNDPLQFEPVPTGKPAAQLNDSGQEIYTVEVEGKSYTVAVASGGDIEAIAEVGAPATAIEPSASAPKIGEPVKAPLAGNVVKIMVTPGQKVTEGETILVLEAMKMETSISAPSAGTIVDVLVKSGDSCVVGDAMVTLG